MNNANIKKVIIELIEKTIKEYIDGSLGAFINKQVNENISKIMNENINKTIQNELTETTNINKTIQNELTETTNINKQNQETLPVQKHDKLNVTNNITRQDIFKAVKEFKKESCKGGIFSASSSCLVAKIVYDVMNELEKIFKDKMKYTFNKIKKEENKETKIKNTITMISDVEKMIKTKLTKIITKSTVTVVGSMPQLKMLFYVPIVRLWYSNRVENGIKDAINETININQKGNLEQLKSDLDNYYEDFVESLENIRSENDEKNFVLFVSFLCNIYFKTHIINFIKSIDKVIIDTIRSFAEYNQIPKSTKPLVVSVLNSFITEYEKSPVKASTLIINKLFKQQSGGSYTQEQLEHLFTQLEYKTLYRYYSRIGE